MATGTGLDAQFGYKLETVWGTPVTVDKFQEFNTESLAWEPTWLEPAGLRVGTKYKRASRLVQSRQTVSGSVELEHATRNMGALWKAALGSTVVTPTVIAASAYKQVHVPGDYLTKSLTIQVGRPEPGGTVKPHTYEGCKVTSWEFSVSDTEYAKLTLEFDGQTEATATALATASYVAAQSVFNFSQVSVFKLGGTPSTAAGETTIAAGVTVAPIVTGFTLKGEVPFANERYGLGNAGIKAEQLENDQPTITGTFSAEYDQTTFYTPFKANTTTAIEVKLEGAIISGSDKDTLSFIIPAAKFKTVTPNVDGPDIVKADVEFECYSNEVDPVCQVKLISADATAI